MLQAHHHCIRSYDHADAADTTTTSMPIVSGHSAMTIIDPVATLLDTPEDPSILKYIFPSDLKLEEPISAPPSSPSDSPSIYPSIFSEKFPPEIPLEEPIPDSPSEPSTSPGDTHSSLTSISPTSAHSVLTSQYPSSVTPPHSQYPTDNPSE